MKPAFKIKIAIAGIVQIQPAGAVKFGISLIAAESVVAR